MAITLNLKSALKCLPMPTKNDQIALLLHKCKRQSHLEKLPRYFRNPLIVRKLHLFGIFTFNVTCGTVYYLRWSKY